MHSFNTVGHAAHFEQQSNNKAFPMGSGPRGPAQGPYQHGGMYSNSGMMGGNSNALQMQGGPRRMNTTAGGPIGGQGQAPHQYSRPSGMLGQTRFNQGGPGPAAGNSLHSGMNQSNPFHRQNGDGYRAP